MSGGLNSYSYVENNPSIKVDPLGLLSTCTVGVDKLWGYKLGPVFHEYSCWYSDNGTKTCRGFGRTPSSNPLKAIFDTVSGIILKDDENSEYGNESCSEDDGNKCMDSCVAHMYEDMEMMGAREPKLLNYSWLSSEGTQCQTFNQSIQQVCSMSCKK